MPDGAIVFDNVSKSFRGRTVLRNISCEILPGQRVGIIGPNGSGKTTLLNLLCGLLRPDSGQITFGGNPIVATRFLLEAGILQDTARCFLSLSGNDNIELFRRGPVFRAPQETQALLDSVGIGDSSRRAFRTYSHGMKQRVGLALALLGYPPILIFDEPTNALDPVGIVEMRSLIKQATAGAGTIIMCSHLLHEVELACDRIMVLKEGNLIASFNLTDVQKMRHLYTIRTVNPAEAVAIVNGIAGLRVLKVEGNVLEVESSSHDGYELLKRLMDAGIRCDEFARKETRLEEVFMDVIK